MGRESKINRKQAPTIASDVLLPKQVTESWYLALTQIYADLFPLNPKSTLKASIPTTNLNLTSKYNKIIKRTHRVSTRILNLEKFTIKKETFRTLLEQKFPVRSQSERKFNDRKPSKPEEDIKISWQDSDTTTDVQGSKVNLYTILLTVALKSVSSGHPNQLFITRLSPQNWQIGESIFQL